MSNPGRRAWMMALFLLFSFTLAPSVGAHVKWFAGYSYADPPLPLGEAITGTFLGLALLSVAVIVLFVLLDSLDGVKRVQARTEAWLEGYRENSLLIIRIGMGVVLLLSWQAGTILAPELVADNEWVGWVQFFLVLLLLFRRTVPLAGLGVLGLVLYDVALFGFFHILDYTLMLGVGWYLLIAQTAKLRSTALPALYATTGFSLCWVAAEKIVYPQWALELLERNPHLTMGLDHEFFLLASAFIELSLGYLLIVCLLQRGLALTITIVFFLTSMTFGKTEVIGHSIVHAILIVFIIEGPGRFHRAPITFPDSLGKRMAFAAVTFPLLVAFLLPAYGWGAQHRFETFEPGRMGHRHDPVEIGAETPLPALVLRTQEDVYGGWNLELVTENFTFAPQSAGRAHVPGEGHAHLYLDGEKRARIYGRWFHLPDLGPGSHEVEVTLNANDHGVLTIDGEKIAAVVRLERD